MTNSSDLFAGDGIASAAVMAAMALASVGLWTLRVAFAARGRKLLGAIVSAVEAVVFAVAFSSLAASLDHPLRVIGYALGVAAGTLLGLVVDERSAHGKSEIQVVVHGADDGLADTLRLVGWPATSYDAHGPDGPVTVTFLAVDDTQVPQVTEILRRLVPTGFWTVQQLRRMQPASIHRREPSHATPTSIRAA